MSTVTPAPTATTRTEGPLTKAATQAQADLKVAIREYDEQIAAFETAKGAGKVKLSQSHSAKASIRSARIRQAELTLAEEGVSFEPWVKPTSSSGSTRQTELSQASIESSLKKVAVVYHDVEAAESTKVSADQRITALLKAAEKRGYKVTDPR